MKKLSLVLLTLIFTATSAVAQKRYDEIKYPELNDFEKAKVETFKMDNGIEFFIVEDRELPLININVTVYSGSILEPSDKAGLASLTGRVMREGGSENYPADELNLILENKAASMESFFGFGSAGAGMNILAEDFDELLPVFIDFIQNPLFPEEKVELAKTQTKSAISRRNDDQGSIAGREFRKLIYGEDAVYTQQTEYATIDNITREDMIALHEEAFVGNNMLVGVIGDFDADEVKKKLQEAFGSLKAGQKTNLIYPEVNYDFQPSVNLINKTDVNQSYVVLGHIGGLRSNPDYAALQVMNNVLSGGFAGRLFQVVRTDLGLAYAVGGSYSSNRNYPGQFNLTVMTKSETTAEAIDAIIGEVKRIQTEPIEEKELNDAKDRFLNSLIFRYDTKREVLSEQINIAFNGLDPNEFDKYVEEIKKVTINDVQRVAEKYLQPENMQILVVGNKEEIGNQLEKYGAVNEIDITIPTPEVAKDETAGDAAAGKEWLNKMADAIIADGTEFTTLNLKGTQTVVTPQGNIELGTEFTINFAEESLTGSVQSPQGTISVNIQDGKGTQALGGQEFPMPPAAVEQQMQTIRYNVVNIALNPDNFEAEYLGEEEMDGKNYAKLRINLEEPVTFIIDMETNLPVEKRSSSFSPQMGAQVEIVEQLTEWTEVDGVKYAYKTVTIQNGDVAQESTVSEHSIVE